MAAVPKFSPRFNAIPIKIPTGIFVDTEANSKIHMVLQRI